MGIIGVLGSIITGREYDDFALFIALLVVNLLFSLVLYALGDIITILDKNRINTESTVKELGRIAQCLEKINTINAENISSTVFNNKSRDGAQDKETKSTGGKDAPTKKVMPADVPYYCGKCGEFGPYDETCPSCGSGVKIRT